MNMKKLVISPLTNKIYWASVDESAGRVTGKKENVTKDAVKVVFQHLTNLEDFQNNGFAGYEFPQIGTDETATICVFNSDTHICLPKKMYEHLLECKDICDYYTSNIY